MNTVRNAYLELHLAVLLFGLTAILGDLIQLPAITIVWWRVLITSASLLFLIRFGKTIRKLPSNTILLFMGIGVLVAIHWVCFYGAVKLSNASIAVVCMATTSVFTSLLEPLLTKQPIKKTEILLGLLVIPGMVLIVQNVDLNMVNGVWVGLLSALLAALFATLNKKWIGRLDPMNITFLELGSAWLFLSLVMPIFILLQPNWEISSFWPSGYDWGYLLVLSLLCTTVAYILALRSLRYLTAFASNLTINLEPIYGVILAWVILKENKELSPEFYIGGSIIIAVVFIYPLINRISKSRELRKQRLGKA